MPDPNPHLNPDLLSAYLDEEVTAPERVLVERHLAACDHCRLELESLRWTVNMLHQLPEVPLPRNFYVTEAMLEPEPRPSLWARLGWPRLVGTLATVAALLLCIVLVGLPNLPGDPRGYSESAEAPVGEIARAPESTETMEMLQEAAPAELELPEEAAGETAGGADEGAATEGYEGAEESITAGDAAEESAEESAEEGAPAEEDNRAITSAQQEAEATPEGLPTSPRAESQSAAAPPTAPGAQSQDAVTLADEGTREAEEERSVEEAPGADSPAGPPLYAAILVLALLLLLIGGLIFRRSRQEKADG